MHNVLATTVQVVQRLNGRIICFDPADKVPTVFWSPDVSMFRDAKGDMRTLWALSSRSEVVAICKLTNVRFVDCSQNPLVPH